MQHHQDQQQGQQQQQQQQQGHFRFNSSPSVASAAGLAALLDTSKGYLSPTRASARPPRQSPPSSLPRRRRVSSSPCRSRYTEQTPPPASSSGSGHAPPWVEQLQYAPPARAEPRRSYTDNYALDPERDHRPSNPPRPQSLGRPGSTRSRSGARSGVRSLPLSKRSQSLGDRMASAVANPREPPRPESLLLYHVSKPEPRGVCVYVVPVCVCSAG